MVDSTHDGCQSLDDSYLTKDALMITLDLTIDNRAHYVLDLNIDYRVEVENLLLYNL